MRASLSLFSLTLAATDASPGNNPSLRNVDWKRQIAGLSVDNPESRPFTIPAGATQLIFDGTRSIALDSSTQFDLSLSPLAADRYRFTWTGGTDPALRTARTASVATTLLTLTANANGTLQVNAPSGTPFAALQSGDEVLIPGTLTGDTSSPFSILNQGQWQVLGVTGSGLGVTLVRPSGQDFSGVSENVTPASNGQFLAFSAAGVQVGDVVSITSGFATPTQKSMAVTAVSSKWFEVESSSPLPLETGILPTSAGMRFYSSGKRYVRVEADQECALRFNGDATSLLQLSPWSPADPAQVAEFVKVGPSWSLSVVNRSSQLLNLLVITAE